MPKTDPKLLAARRELRTVKSHLQSLTQTVSMFLDAIDKVMVLPASKVKGQKIAQLCNHLELRNDMAKHFGLGQPLEKSNDKTRATGATKRPTR